MKTSTVVRLALGLALGLLASGCSGGGDADLCKGRKAGDLVITEFLADPSGTDTGKEWIEIFNTVGTPVDLKGMTIYVKKTDGTGLKAHLIRAGTVASRGFFTLGDVRMGALPAWIGYAYVDALGALSNTDGIIGIKCQDTVIHEIKYTVSPKPGHSRQLNGAVAPDAALNTEADWCDAPDLFTGTDYGTPGAANPLCVVAPGADSCLDNGIARKIVVPSAGDLVITEVMANPKALPDTVGEWLEVQANASVDLNGLSLIVGAAKNALSAADCVRLNAGEYGVLAGSTDAGLPNVRATFALALGNSGFTVSLATADAGIIDSATVPAALDGISWQLDPAKPSVTDNDDPLNFCRATVRFGDPDAGDFGTPGAANTTCPVILTGMCLDNGTPRPIVAPLAGELQITEVMANPKALADSLGEWFEVRTSAAVDLNGLSVQVGTSKSTVSSLDCVRLAPGDYGVVASSPDAGTPNVRATFSSTLPNSAGFTLTLSTAAGPVDSATVPSSLDGISWQLDPAKTAPTDNDDPLNYCRATMRYGDAVTGDFGTPGVANNACPVAPDPNQCLASGGALRPIVRPAVGDLVISEVMADPNRTADSDGEWFEVVANAAIDLNGIALVSGATASPLTSQLCLDTTVGAHLVFAHSADPAVNGYLPAVQGTFIFSLPNSGGTLSVRGSDGGVLDTMTYPAALAGASTQLDGNKYDVTSNDVLTNLCVTDAGVTWATFPDGGPSDRGSPGMKNKACP